MSNVSIKYLEDENGQRFSPVVNIKGIYDDSENSLLDIFYPVGSYYETSDDNFDPNKSWGGTWTRDTQGLVTVGAYDEGTTKPGNDRLYITQGLTQGEVEHTLTIDEMPSHNHDRIPRLNIEDPPSYGSVYGYKSDGAWSEVTGNTGGGQPHNNIQPSVGVYRWHRTA